MQKEIMDYNAAQTGEDKKICEKLCGVIERCLPGAEAKVWHAHPVWFLDGNPVAGYSKMKEGIRLLFWSGQSFEEPGLKAEGSFKAAEARYGKASEIDTAQLEKWLENCIRIQWDYKNIVKRKGKLEALKGIDARINDN